MKRHGLISKSSSRQTLNGMSASEMSRNSPHSRHVVSKSQHLLFGGGQAGPGFDELQLFEVQLPGEVQQAPGGKSDAA